MAKSASNPIAYYDSFASELTSKFERIKKLIPNRESSGDYHEEIIRVALRNFLPKRYSIKKGFIYADGDIYSKQVDILIIDENVPSAYIFQEGEFAIVRPSSVIAAVEVKSQFDKPRFAQALRNIASVKSLYDAIEGRKITTAIFGYKGTEPQKDKLHEWFTCEAANELKDKQHLGPDLILFFRYETILARYNPETKLIGDSEYYHAFVQSDEIGKPSDDQGSGWQLTVLLSHILNSCQRCNNSGPIIALSGGPSEANLLLKSARFTITADAFKLGEGGADYTPPTK